MREKEQKLCGIEDKIILGATILVGAVGGGIAAGITAAMGAVQTGAIITGAAVGNCLGFIGSVIYLAGRDDNRQPKPSLDNTRATGPDNQNLTLNV